jgi:NADPH:quinone reductase-like Zn-dependent oxidoreductase
MSDSFARPDHGRPFSRVKDGRLLTELSTQIQSIAMSHFLHSSALYSLANQVALVTGGGSGIGYMIASGLAANGAKVYIAGRRKEVLEKAASSYKADQGSIVP